MKQNRTTNTPSFNPSNIPTTRRTKYKSNQETKKTAEDVGSTQNHTVQAIKTQTLKCDTSRHARPAIFNA
jgi:hypothetical protein